MPKKIPIFYGAVMLTAVNFLLYLTGTAFQVYISGHIGPEGVGLVQLVLSVGMLAMTVGMAGIRTATMYLTAEELAFPQRIQWVLHGCINYSLLFSTLTAGLLYFFADSIARCWIGAEDTADAVRILAVFLPVCCLNGVMSGYFTAAGRISALAVTEVTEQIISITITILLLHINISQDPGKACMAVVTGSGIGSCATLTTLVILRVKENPPCGKPLAIANRLMNTAVPLAAADNLKSGITTAEKLIIPKRLTLFPGERNPMATFGMISGMVFPLMMFPAAILFGLCELLIPELSRCKATGSKKRICYLVNKSLRLALLYGILCGGILFTSSPALCRTLYHNNLVGKYLRIISWITPVLYCDAVTDAMTKGLGQQKVCVRYNIITASLDLILLFVLLPYYGINGYFFSFSLTHLLNFSLSLRRLRKITETHSSFSVLFRSTFAGILALVPAAAVKSAPLAGICYTVVFFCFLTLFHVTEKEDFLWAVRLLKKK